MTVREDRHQVRITEDETQHLDNLKARHNFSSRSDAIRYCIQQMAVDDNTVDGKTIRNQLDETKAIIELYGTASFVAITELFSLLLRLLDEDNALEVTDPNNMRKELYQKIFNQAIQVEATFETMQKKVAGIKARAEAQPENARTGYDYSD